MAGQNFSLCHHFQTLSGTHKSLIQWASCAKQLDGESDHIICQVPRLRIHGALSPFFLCVFMAWCCNTGVTSFVLHNVTTVISLLKLLATLAVVLTLDWSEYTGNAKNLDYRELTSKFCGF